MLRNSNILIRKPEGNRMLERQRLKGNIKTYRVIQNDCRGFNNLSYTIDLR